MLLVSPSLLIFPHALLIVVVVVAMCKSLIKSLAQRENYLSKIVGSLT